MSLDARIVQAVEEAVEEFGQSPDLSRKLIAWLDAITSGNEDITDIPAAARHLEILYDETAVTLEDDEEGVS